MAHHESFRGFFFSFLWSFFATVMSVDEFLDLDAKTMFQKLQGVLIWNVICWQAIKNDRKR